MQMGTMEYMGYPGGLNIILSFIMSFGVADLPLGVYVLLGHRLLVGHLFVDRVTERIY